jgi:hypothetical protein
LDACGPGGSRELAPEIGLIPERIERQLNARQTDILQLLQQLLWIGRLQGPTAHRQTLKNRSGTHARYNDQREPIKQALASSRGFFAVFSG